MCSIPGLPTPGSEVPVLITRVNLNPSCGLVELWVNIDDGRKHVYEQMREENQIPKQTFCESEGNPGDLCLVHINETWHRARIVSIHGQTYNVFLVDQGQSHIATSKILAWGQSDSFLLPPEIESCILANVLSLENNWSERATKFLKSLPGKTFNGLVQDVLMPDRTILLDIPIVSKHLCKVGFARKIHMGQFKCLVLASLHLPKGEASEACSIKQKQNHDVGSELQIFGQYLYPELLTDTFETVEITEVNDPLHIFCQVSIFSKALKTLSEQIQQHYEDSSTSGKAQPQACGTPCAARGINGKWYRSVLKRDVATSDGAVEVLHVDHGKTEFVPVGDIRPLHEKFLRMPVVTYLCSLDGVKENGMEWTADQIDNLKLVLQHQRVVAKFERYNIPQDIYYVTLYTADNTCINSCFIEKAGFSSDSKTEQDSNVHIDSITASFLKSLGDEHGLDFNLNVDGLQENMFPCSKNLPVNVRKDDDASFGKQSEAIQIKKHPDPVMQSNGHLSLRYPSVTHNVLHEHLFPIESAVNVKISCIESLEKFWCQTADNSDSLRLLMQDMQNHYASSHCQSLVESICVARHPDNGMWYRARIIADHHSPVVDVRFVDYGETRKVPMQDLRPIDPGFLQLNAQAFQCCLFSLKHPTNPAAATWSGAALAEFQKFVGSVASSNSGLKCIIKAVMPDSQGLSLHVVDVETPFESACTMLAQKWTQGEAHMQVPPLVTSDAYNYSTHNTEVGGKEKVWITYSESVNHFYCQLDRNSHLFDKVMENVKQLMRQPQCTDPPLGLNSVCFAKYTDNQWYRGQIIAMSPNLQVHFVDYGDTLAVNKSDICPCPVEASTARSVPVQAVPLGLFDVPADVPQEVNKWFADLAFGHYFTISVVAKDAKEKLIVELCDGSLNVNVKVREMIANVQQRKETGLVQLTDQQLSESSKQTFSVPREECQTQEHMNVSPLRKMTEQNKVHSSNGMCVGAEQEMTLQSMLHVSVPEGELGKTLDERKKTSSSARITDLPPKLIKQGLSAEVYISHFSNPFSVFVQLQKEENEMHSLLKKLNEPQSLCVPVDFDDLQIGDLVKAEFPDDSSWYRAVVRHKLEDNIVHVEFIDFGNEATIPCVKTSYLDKELVTCPKFSIPCSLGGVNNKHDKLDEEAALIFKRATAENPKKTFTCIFTQETENVWDVILEDQDISLAETFFQGGHTESNVTQLNCPEGSVNICSYKKPNIFQNKTEEVYASCIVGPHYFWCQPANTEDLNKVSRLAQEVGQSEQRTMFPETLDPGSPCLAVFASDKQWYRAQVIRKTGNTLFVLFIDYGNESEVDIKDVTSLPPSLFEMAPQAFLCSLNGFDESKGAWDDSAFDDFYNLLVDKPLNVTVFDMEDHLEIAVPQYTVKIEYGNMVVNKVMEKYWKGFAKENPVAESPESETSKGGQTESTVPQVNCSEGNMNICSYKKPNISQNKTEEVYASCIVGPHYFWCQPANTEDLNKVSRLTQEVGQSEQHTMFPETLDPGSPCLALFASDKQWYRAQVIRKTGNSLFVLFIDYGNESDVDIKDVRSLPPSLFETAPQAFLCSLDGFDDSKGTWDDRALDDFYNLLVDKPLNMTMFNMEDHLEIAVPQYKVKIECGNMVVNKVMEKYWKGFATESAMAESCQSETLNGGQTESNMTQLNCPQGNMNICRYKKPNISQNKTEEVYASCIVGPHYFWCQPANTEDLNEVSRLAQELGQSEQRTMFLETLGPGSPCLALFASDKQWYRAQVIRKTGNSLFVLFIDYGNESDVDIKDVRSLPPSLFETAPQAFLCSLDGFDDSKGTWDDRALDDFYNLLVDKPLNMTMFNMEDHLEIAVPQYKVKIECGNMVVNKVMEKYWKGFATESAMAESCQSETLNGGQTESNMTQLNCPQGNMNICRYKKPNISQNKTEEVYASCIVGPHYFWCQPANTEDLNEVSRLAQELGQSEQRTMFLETLGPGSPCLALFASDKQWYRAQVIRKTGNSLFVLFIDYGNESDVDIKDVRSLPPSLFETAPQAFLCSLDGFDDSKGTWDDRALDYFYNLLVDIPLNMTMFNMEDHLEIAVPQYKVKIEYGNMVVNKVMEKYWKGFATENAMAESPQSGVLSSLDQAMDKSVRPTITKSHFD